MSLPSTPERLAAPTTVGPVTRADARELPRPWSAGVPRRPVVIVTEASGPLGARVCAMLSEAYDVAGLDRVPPPGRGVETWFPCDLRDERDVERALALLRARGVKRVASLVHLAGLRGLARAAPTPCAERCAESTRGLLRGAAGLALEQFVLASALPGARDTLAAEALLAREATMRTVILRSAWAYDEDCHSVPLALEMRGIFEGRLSRRPFAGDARAAQCFVHLDDLAACLGSVVSHRAQLSRHEVFVVGEPEAVSWAERSEVLGNEIHGRKWPGLRAPWTLSRAGTWLRAALSTRSPSAADAAVLAMSSERERAALGWRPLRRLRRALPEMARRLVADPVGWYAENGIGVPAGLERQAEARARGDGE